MRNLHRALYLTGLLTCLLLSELAMALEVEGVELPDSATVAGETLVLNGAGLRSKFFFSIYVGGLYLPQRAGDVEAVLAMAGPKRVVLHFLYDEIERGKLVDAWNEGFGSNLSADERAALGDRIERFNALFQSVRKGDEIVLDYVPGKGTHVVLNGERQGTVEGEDFARAWLRIFIGEEPADSDLKRGMLGG